METENEPKYLIINGEPYKTAIVNKKIKLSWLSSDINFFNNAIFLKIEMNRNEAWRRSLVPFTPDAITGSRIDLEKYNLRFDNVLRIYLESDNKTLT